MNPYAAFLENRNPIDTIAATPARLDEIATTLGPTGVERQPAPGKWNAREIVTHLADTEIAFAFRLRQAIAEPAHVIQPFDQDHWAATYAAFDINAALATFATVRAWNVTFIRSLPAAAFAKELTHPERGSMTFQVLVETMAGHDLNHLRQLETIIPSAA